MASTGGGAHVENIASSKGSHDVNYSVHHDGTLFIMSLNSTLTTKIHEGGCVKT